MKEIDFLIELNVLISEDINSLRQNQIKFENLANDTKEKYKEILTSLSNFVYNARNQTIKTLIHLQINVLNTLSYMQVRTMSKYEFENFIKSITFDEYENLELKSIKYIKKYKN